MVDGGRTSIYFYHEIFFNSKNIYWRKEMRNKDGGMGNRNRS